MPHPTRTDTILDYLATHRQELVDFAAQLVATPSTNPPGDERAVTRVILDRLATLGMTGAEIVARVPERPNLLYRQPGRRGSPHLILNGHTDTKSVGEADRQLWETDPLQPTIIDGKLYGVGSTDMKGALAAMLYAAAALHSLDPPPAGDLTLIFTANEEAPGDVGANWLTRHLDLQADFCLVGEPCGIQTEFESLPLSSRRGLLFNVKVHGTQMHSSISDRFPSVNASVKMAWVLWRLSRDLKLRHEPHPLYPQGPTVNLGDVVRGGLHYGVYPGYAEFGSDIRLTPGMTRDGVRADLEAVLDQLCQEDPELQVELEFLGEPKAEWEPLTGDEPFVRLLQAAGERVLGRPLPFGGFPAFTDGYWFSTQSGIPTVPAFGPGLLPLAHRPNEYVPVQGIVQASQIYALAALAYLDGESEA
jgi:acetylornithine deacetylase